MREVVAESWLTKLKSVLYDLVDEPSPAGARKNIWEVALEYVLLTENTTKVHQLTKRGRRRRKE